MNFKNLLILAITAFMVLMISGVAGATMYGNNGHYGGHMDNSYDGNGHYDGFMNDHGRGFVHHTGEDNHDGTYTEKLNPKFVPGICIIYGEVIRDSHEKRIKDLVRVEFISSKKSWDYLGANGRFGFGNRYSLAGTVIDYAIANGEYLTLQYQDQTRVTELFKNNVGQKVIIFSGRAR